MIRIGILGAARIAPPAIIRPAHDVNDVEIAAVAARDPDRAHQFATKHGIPRLVGSYEELVTHPAIDAIYNPLPNGLHGRWTTAALEAGKHVLCEKPFTANAEEAEQVAAVATRSGLVCMEAFHYRYHPLAERLVEIARSGELGALRHLEAWLYAPLVRSGDIRWQLALAGGSLMDMGCYPVHLVRSVAGEEPEVTAASAKLRSPDIDREVTAQLRFPSGATGRIVAGMLTAKGIGVGCRVEFEHGSVRVFNFIAPQLYHRFVVRRGDRRTSEKFGRTPTYTYQLRAFAAAVEYGTPFPTGVDDSIANMRVIDAIYEAAGLPRREPTPA